MFRIEIDIPQRYRLSCDKKRVRRVLARGGAEIAAVARRKIRASAGAGRVYRVGGGFHQASAPGQPPVSLSGALAASIRARPFRDGDGVAVRDSEFYALFLEKGAQGGVGSGRKGIKGQVNKGSRKAGAARLVVGNRILEPRPFLSAALDERAPSLAQRIKQAIVEDVEFRRIAASAAA